MKKVLFAAALLAAMTFGAGAQTLTRSQNLTEVTGLRASQGFEVTVHYAETPRVEWTVDEALENYVKVYTLKKELVLAYEEKLVPKEVRKAYKQKNAVKPTFRVTLWCPRLDEVTLSDNVVLNCPEALSADHFRLETSKNAQVLKMDIQANQATLKLAGKSTVGLSLTARNITVACANSSSLTLRQSSDALNITAEGGAKLNVSGETGVVECATKGLSKTILSGRAESISARGAGSSEVDAINLPVKSAELTLTNSCTWTLDAKDVLKLDMAGGSSVFFNSQPRFDIVRIVSSTVRRYGDTRK